MDTFNFDVFWEGGMGIFTTTSLRRRRHVSRVSRESEGQLLFYPFCSQSSLLLFNQQEMKLNSYNSHIVSNLTKCNFYLFNQQEMKLN